MSGGAVCIEKYKNDPRVGGILFVGYPGQAGGQGIADVLFGLYSPSGRLTQTFYRQPFVDEVSFYDMNMRPSASSPGRGYRFYSGENVVYEFGHGLSYSTFEYKLLQLQSSSNNDDIFVDIKFSVQNVGSYIHSAAEVVMAFLKSPSDATLGSPIRQLRAFDKINLKTGEISTIEFHFNSKDFSLANESGIFEVTHGDWIVEIGSLVLKLTI
jgi:beta-D-xylosidase 4